MIGLLSYQNTTISTSNFAYRANIKDGTRTDNYTYTAIAKTTFAMGSISNGIKTDYYNTTLYGKEESYTVSTVSGIKTVKSSMISSATIRR
jgi:hypothetical protein